MTTSAFLLNPYVVPMSFSLMSSCFLWRLYMHKREVLWFYLTHVITCPSFMDGNCRIFHSTCVRYGGRLCHTSPCAVQLKESVVAKPICIQVSLFPATALYLALYGPLKPRSYKSYVTRHSAKRQSEQKYRREGDAKQSEMDARQRLLPCRNRNKTSISIRRDERVIVGLLE